MIESELYSFVSVFWIINVGLKSATGWNPRPDNKIQFDLQN